MCPEKDILVRWSYCACAVVGNIYIIDIHLLYLC